jgi:hypothetical protein
MRPLLGRYGAARLTPAAATTIERTANGARVLQAVLPPATDGKRPYSRSDYLALRIEGSGPLPEWVRITRQVSQEIRVRAMAGERAHAPAVVFFPVNRGPQSCTVEVQGGDPAAGLELFRVTEQEQFPVLMTLVLPDDWSTLSTHKVLTR